MAINLTDIFYEMLEKKLKNEYDLAEYYREAAQDLVDDYDMDADIREIIGDRISRGSQLMHNAMVETARYVIKDACDEMED